MLIIQEIEVMCKIWKKLILFILAEIIFVGEYACIMLKKECPPDEVHKSCSFHEEYTCWVQEDMMDRVKSPPARLPHCRAGCYCKKGLVREFPRGTCIVAAGCRNRILQAMLIVKLPTEYAITRK